ncbi:unnamed protein product [Bathycoccus prasinos]
MGGNKRGREEEKDDDEEEDSLAVREREERRKEERAESVFEAQMRKKDEELKEVKEELRNLSPPTPLWKIVTDKQYKDIFETHILSKLNELSFRVFREVNTESRDACRRSGRKLQETLEVSMWSGKPPERKKKKETRKLEGKEAQHHFCDQAALTGNLALVRWLREVKKFDWSQRTISSAAHNGHLHIVKYCMEQKCPRTKLQLACAFAAKSGHLDILKYLRENGAPWDSWTCFYARENNHPECLLYALDNGCRNDKHVPQQQQ